MCDVYLHIAIGTNVTFCIIGVLTAQHEICTNFSRPSSLPKKGRGLGVRLGHAALYASCIVMTCIWHAQIVHKVFCVHSLFCLSTVNCTIVVLPDDSWWLISGCTV